GQLGGLLAYRREGLDAVQNELGRLAVGLTNSFNAVHATGEDLAGNAGGEFFRIDGPRIIPNTRNTGTAQVTAEITDANQLTGDDYQLRYSDDAGGTYTLVTLPVGTERELSPAEVTSLQDPAQGLELGGVTLK